MLAKARKEDLVVQKTADEVLVYDLKTNKAVCLNETSALIWENCNGKNSLQDLSAIINKEFGEPVNDDFIKLAIEQLKKENLIENSNDLIIDFKGISRRKIIKKVGFMSLVALPLVFSINVPKAYAQGSLLAFGEPCTASTQCQSGCCREDRGVNGNPGNPANNGTCGNENPVPGDARRCQGDGVGTS